MLDLDAELWNAIIKQDIKPTRMKYSEEIIGVSSLHQLLPIESTTSTRLQAGVLQSVWNGSNSNPSWTNKIFVPEK
jgi:hypothetical protein